MPDWAGSGGGDFLKGLGRAETVFVPEHPAALLHNLWSSIAEAQGPSYKLGSRRDLVAGVLMSIIEYICHNAFLAGLLSA